MPSLFLDHFGWLGYQVHPAGGLRMLGKDIIDFIMDRIPQF